MARTVVMLLLLVRPAAADPAPPAVAFNEPIGWPSGVSVAGSVYLGVSARQVLRVNLASYEQIVGGFGDLVSGLAGGDGADRAGHTTDVGVGWLGFPRRAYDGAMVEAGVIYRHRDLAVTDEDAMYEYDATRSDEVAARALVGWSWLFTRRVFVSLAVGVSAGYEFGSETARALDEDPLMTARVSRWRVDGETCLRFGVVLR
ncbi:MAG TPA: hypothetical protein VLX92_27380 [Kofleriaceae bacterium]|nr:hypothetical protein [Kofleriaceae bacterium]